MIAALSFLNPWILSALVALPAIWFLLRVTPPVPKTIWFPAARFLSNMEQQEQSPQKTPWYILALRMFIALFLIVGLSHPVMNKNPALSGDAPTFLVIDNGWASATLWPEIQKEAQRHITDAKRQNQSVYILTTAPTGRDQLPLYKGPVPAAEASSIVSALTIYSWPSSYDTAQKHLQSQDIKWPESLSIFWLSNGLRDDDPATLMKYLKDKGKITVIKPKNEKLPVLLSLASQTGQNITASLTIPNGLSDTASYAIQALDKNGQVLDTAKAKASERRNNMLQANLDLPGPLRSKVARLVIENHRAAGSVYLLDDEYRQYNVGLLTEDGSKVPLVDNVYYIEKALEPYATINKGDLTTLLGNQNLNVLILPDMGAILPEALNKLEEWVNNGGVLIRFAGPKMIEGQSFLVPVPLRQGGRTLEGALTWEEPMKIVEFPGNSPYKGLDIPKDVNIKKQILAEPIPELTSRTWAKLEDGTSLITANKRDNGLIVLIHTTATPEWSNLSLSGLFVQILRRTIALAGSSFDQKSYSGILEPIATLNGYGLLTEPDVNVKEVNLENINDLRPSALNPPGLYGYPGNVKALNLGDMILSLTGFNAGRYNVKTATYTKDTEKDLMPVLLITAFILFLIDWLIMIAIQAGFSKSSLARVIKNIPVKKAAFFLILTSCLLAPHTASAYTEAQAIKYASDLHLAYVKTGNSAVNSLAKNGLEGLRQTLINRTSVEPAGVVGVDLEKDNLAFFPFIYWPITASQSNLSIKAIQNFQSYINQGGMVLIDTRDGATTAGTSGFRNSQNIQALRRLTENIDIPPLKPIADTHVLGKSFYLLDSFPGKTDNATLWVIESGIAGQAQDGVSSIIIGSHDWASAWSSGAAASFAGRQGSFRQQELAMRFGINILMYALTGNYKADQVHLPHILERLDQ